MTEELLVAAAELGKARRRLAAAKEEEAEAAKHMRALLGQSPTAVDWGGTGVHMVRTTAVTQNRIDTTQLKVDHPDIAARYTRQVTSSRLTLHPAALELSAGRRQNDGTVWYELTDLGKTLLQAAVETEAAKRATEQARAEIGAAADVPRAEWSDDDC